jgi:hypothetical protein
MGTSAPAPPGDGHAPDGDEDELELTSIMDADQRRALQKAAREKAGEAEPEELQRPTARPPPEAVAVAQGEASIPKAQRVPADVGRGDVGDRPTPVAPTGSGASEPARAADPFSIVAFVLLFASVAYALSR